jgi:hypothetical protein
VLFLANFVTFSHEKRKEKKASLDHLNVKKTKVQKLIKKFFADTIVGPFKIV